MESEFLQRIRERCKASRLHNNRMRALMPTGAAPSLRANFARCAIDLALEHHSGLIRVVEAGEYGTGGALLRPVLEASTTGYWFVYVATCDEIKKLPTTPVDNPEDDIPKLAEMIKALIPIFPLIQRMSDELKRGGRAKWLHKYTHGSTPQLNRRAKGGWTEGDLLLTLIRGDMFATLSACLETVIAPSSALAHYGFNARDELGFELETNFTLSEPIPKQPHSLPSAPLLEDGCGPPFP